MCELDALFPQRLRERSRRRVGEKKGRGRWKARWRVGEGAVADSEAFEISYREGKALSLHHYFFLSFFVD
jgi:hypothetical protein